MMENSLLAEIRKIAENTGEKSDFLMKAAQTIQNNYPQYNWIGFYFLKEEKLHVGPYVGKPTPHTIIDLNSGVCGAAVSQQETIVVDDVNADPRYLACSLETKSEIVIPIRCNGEIIGELDIDSNKKAAFTEDDKMILEEAAELIGDILSKY
ncbi:MAG: GAF domain-containing protein [candidate division Zixibacteria bacterium]